MLLKKKQIREEESGRTSADRYLITYADLITLLLGLFVILYVTSRVDEERYKEFSKAFADYFKSTDPQNGSNELGVFQGVKKGIPEPVMPSAAKRSLQEIQADVQKILAEYIQRGDINVETRGSNVVITLPEKLLFKSGKAEIETIGEEVLDKLSSVLHGLSKDQEIDIDGHTDSDPIKNFRYPSNWHLSVARAANIAYSLTAKGVPEHSIVIRGFGATRPIADNATPEGKAKNRRVEITITDLKQNTPTTQGYQPNEPTK